MFIASYHDKRRDHVLVWEKTPDGGRKLREHAAPYFFYVPDPDGTYTTVTNERVKKIVCSSKRNFEEACTEHRLRFESDLSPQERVMMTYFGQEVPKLTVGFLDIEVDYDPKIGWARPSNPYAPINALTLYRSDLQSYFTLAVPPPGWNKELSASLGDNFFLFDTERELLEEFLVLLEDVDVITGWNSEFFDMPYIGRRIEMVLGARAMQRLAFENAPAPRWGEKERFKNSTEKELVLDIGSRVHLDYMRLFKKFNLGGRQSYSLSAIGQEEVDEDKISYNGTLYALYHNNFEKFLEYNRHDVRLIIKIDAKFKYIELANRMVHEGTVNFNSIFGSVALIDTSIINFCHHTLNRIVFDRSHKPGYGVEGAIVMNPLIGLHKWIASCDINSLYPNTYRSINLSPEKIVGQLFKFEDDWRSIYTARREPTPKNLEKLITFIPENAYSEDDHIKLSVGEMIDFLETSKYAVSAYGTVLDQSNGEGLLPAVLSYWFNERKKLQGLKKQHAKNAEELIKSGKAKDSPEVMAELILSEYYDMLQGVKKVQLNSTYGATLNEFCRFHDPRLGASTTGTGRQITTHMINTIAELLIGLYAPKLVKVVNDVKPKKKKSGSGGGDSVSAGEGIENVYTMDLADPRLGPLYSDTDSCYFTMDALVSNLDDAVAAADSVVDQVNESFKQFMADAFMCQPNFDDKIRAVREIVAPAGILRAKKKYIMFVGDSEGKRIDPNDEKKCLKTQGSDIKLSSTPEEIRGFLKEVTMMVLKGAPKQTIVETVIQFRRQLKANGSRNALDYASIMSVNNLADKYALWSAQEAAGLGRVNLPANVRASINHNECLKMFELENEQPITSGSKIKLIWLTRNDYGFTNMSFSSDLEELPVWFTDRFNIDVRLTEQKLIDQKLGNIFEPIGWDIPTEQTYMAGKLLSF